MIFVSENDGELILFFSHCKISILCLRFRLFVWPSNHDFKRLHTVVDHQQFPSNPQKKKNNCLQFSPIGIPIE